MPAGPIQERSVGGGRVVMLVGPTAVGKSEVALHLAEALGGEIVSLDSRQMYAGLDIGTAKPTPEERARVRHHLIDITAPDQPLTLADVLGRVYGAVDGILAAGRLPLVVGGTGQYVRALREGWEVPEVPPDWPLRSELEAFAATHGPAALHNRLAEVDPASAQLIQPTNVRRMIRALEIYRHAGEPMSAIRARSGPRYNFLILGLRRDRPSLYARVDARIDAMIAAGLEAEVRGMVAAGYGFDLPAMSGVGYAEWGAYLARDIGLDEVVAQIRHNTRRLVRSQGAWFQAGDPGIQWFDLPESPEKSGEALGPSAEALGEALEAIERTVRAFAAAG